MHNEMTPSTNPGEPSAGAVRIVTTISKEHYPMWSPEFKERLALIIDRETGIVEAREE
jgi:MOSC domain-containing protein YiiM